MSGYSIEINITWRNCCCYLALLAFFIQYDESEVSPQNVANPGTPGVNSKNSVTRFHHLFYTCQPEG